MSGPALSLSTEGTPPQGALLPVLCAQTHVRVPRHSSLSELAMAIMTCRPEVVAPQDSHVPRVVGTPCLPWPGAILSFPVDWDMEWGLSMGRPQSSSL